VYNEPDSEHQHTPQTYTAQYDAIVQGIWRHADPHRKLKFCGLALERHKMWDWFNYFLNATNHAPGIPIDFISYHFYAIGTSRTDPKTFEVTPPPPTFDPNRAFSPLRMTFSMRCKRWRRYG
jgi:hypothetical protein